MKKLFLIMASGLMMAGTLTAQVSKDFIRNYKAPEFKLRSLNLTLNGSSRAGEDTPTNNFNSRSTLSGSARFGLISNSEKYQGNFNYQLGVSARVNTESSFILPSTSLSFRGENTNRWYLSDFFYFGIHHNSQFGFSSNFYQKDIDIDRHSFIYNINPAFAIGIGKVEYVEGARRALDVELLLEKSGRLDNYLDDESAQQLADALTQLNYKRGFDSRLLRIWQLEQLDSVVTGLDLVTRKDMRYMAYLSDAFVYANRPQRLSGKRLEWGLVQRAFGVLSQENTNFFTSNMLSGGYISANVYLPTSYSIQHNVGASVLAGIEYQPDLPSTQNLWSSAYYTFGWFPNTRTSLESSASINILARENSQIRGDMRLSSSLYYYLSPRTRLTVSAWISTDQGFANHGFSMIPSGHLPVGNFDQGFGARIGITHAIY